MPASGIVCPATLRAKPPKTSQRQNASTRRNKADNNTVSDAYLPELTKIGTSTIDRGDSPASDRMPLGDNSTITKATIFSDDSNYGQQTDNYFSMPNTVQEEITYPDEEEGRRRPERHGKLQPGHARARFRRRRKGGARS